MLGRLLLNPQNLSYPVHLHGAHSSRIAAVCEDKLIVHNGLDFAAEEPARRMDGQVLVADQGPIAAVREQARGICRKAFQKAFKNRLDRFGGHGRRALLVARWRCGV